MQDFILIALPLLIILRVAYSRLRRHIKSLEDQVAAQGLACQKLRESNRALQAELKRIECRIGSQVSAGGPDAESAPEPLKPAAPEVPPVLRVVPDEPEVPVPPPLPVFRAAVPEPPPPDRSATARPEPEWESSTPSEAYEPPGPSLFDRIPWHDILARMRLLPPAKSVSGETAESQLAAWWVIRIGLVLLIIASVFFGIHVSQHTPPWLRVLTLGLVSLGTVVLGARMKDKLEGFGRAIIGGGFALLYFTAFAAFALPATKVIDAPAAGALAQLSALVIAIIWSLWKRDRTVATLTLFLGLVSCGFSHSHDLDRFATVGLLLLAATGAFLFAMRGWLAPFITALVGSWAGFGVFALLDWLRGEPPEFLQLMVALVALTVVFEVGNLVCIARGRHVPGERLRRWLILGNTAAAALLGYGVTRLAHPDQLSTFYFIFAALYSAFTGIHHLRTTDRAVTESLFLKTSALLCLGFAAAFSGPVRWLAIAFQAFALLWTARRSGSRWIAAGFVLVLAASIGWFWRDLLKEPPPVWSWLDRFRIAGGLYLVLLTAQLAMHARWFPLGIGGSDANHQKQARGFRLAGALVIGFTALALSLTPPLKGHSDPLWYLFLLSGLIGALCPLIRNAIPCMAAALPLVSCYIAYVALPPDASRSAAALWFGVTLVITAFGLSEMIRRHWPKALAGGLMVRDGTLLAGLATLLPFTTALGSKFALSGDAGIGVFALFPIVACAAVWCRSQSMAGGPRPRLSIGFQIATGVLVVMGGAFTCEDSSFFPIALAVAGLPLLALARWARVWNVLLAAALPILAGFFSLWETLGATQTSGLVHDSINLTVLLLISIGLATIAWKRNHPARLQKAGFWCDALLHTLGILSLHLFLQKHLGEGQDFLAAALLGLLLFAVSRRFPFRVLEAISWLPVALACGSGVIAGNWLGVKGTETWFMASGVVVLTHLIIAGHPHRKSTRQGIAFLTETSAPGLARAAPLIAVVAWTLIALAAAERPWQAAALTGVGLLCSSLWRWNRIPLLGHLGLGPLVLAFCYASALILAINALPQPTAWILTSLSLTSAGLAANGMMMASAVRRVLNGRITARSLLPWAHGGGALLLAFAVCTLDRLVGDKLTAVFWGLSAIVLFVCGLLSGLRAYRLAGLIGLVFCIAHIFIWDIQDTFYRIIAFFVTGLVLLVIGFLYHRFRDRITALDC